MIRTVCSALTLLPAVLSSLLTGCAVATSSIEQALIREDARNVQRLSFPESKTKQISYDVELVYPGTALADSHFAQLTKLGWSKCYGYREGWESYIDASKEGHERSVFQNLSYWYKDKALLTIAMRYDASAAPDKRRLDAPDNRWQRVVILEDHNPGAKEWLKISCPKQ
jgi:hypothetical protein